MALNLRMIIGCKVALVIAVMFVPNEAYSQSGLSKESPGAVVGGSTGIRPPSVPPAILGSQNLEIMRHRDISGRPCLTVNGFARPRTVNQNLYDHVIVANNQCSKSIKIRVCYFKTQQCVAVEAKSYGRQEAILGTTPAIKDFQFEFKETF